MIASILDATYDSSRIFNCDVVTHAVLSIIILVCQTLYFCVGFLTVGSMTITDLLSLLPRLAPVKP